MFGQQAAVAVAEGLQEDGGSSISVNRRVTVPPGDDASQTRYGL
jgi:hypothetical protein